MRRAVRTLAAAGLVDRKRLTLEGVTYVQQRGAPRRPIPRWEVRIEAGTGSAAPDHAELVTLGCAWSAAPPTMARTPAPRTTEPGPVRAHRSPAPARRSPGRSSCPAPAPACRGAAHIWAGLSEASRHIDRWDRDTIRSAERLALPLNRLVAAVPPLMRRPEMAAPAQRVFDAVIGSADDREVTDALAALHTALKAALETND